MNKLKAKQLTFFLIIFVFLNLSSGCQKNAQKENKTTSEKSIPVTTTRPLQKAMNNTLHAVGQIESLSAPIISGETDGKVLSIHVDEGDKINAGELLATLDDRLLEILLAQEQSELKRIQILIRNKRKTLSRRTKLAKSKSISEDSVDEAQTELSSFLAQQTVLQNKIAAIQYRLDKTKIKAPISATISKRYISIGDYIQEDEHLFKLVSVSKLRIRLPVPENKVPELSSGQSVLLSTPASIHKIEAKISKLLPSINQNNKALEIIIDIDNPGDWRPGATVVGNIILEHFSNALLIPQKSIVQRPSGDVVYVYDSSSKTVKERIIKTGHTFTPENNAAKERLQNQSLIQITSGLQQHDDVIINGAPYLTDNAKVSLVSE